MSKTIQNILLAEDDRATSLVVKKQLEAKGFHVEIALNGIEALNILTAKTIDLIITDVVMPKMDGVDLYRAVKENPRTANIPIIIVTDKAIFKDSFTNLGVSSFVEKTTNIALLLEKIDHIESERAQAKHFRKILISSNNQTVINQMQTALQGMKFLVAAATTSDDIMSKALIMVPHILAIDVLFQDNASAYEIIRALRSFTVLKNLKIITYAYLPEDMGLDVDSIHTVENSIKFCTEAGADKYIGRFNQGFFLEKVLDQFI